MALKYLYVPSGVQAEKAYGVLPNSANADFASFSRNGAGSRVDKNGLINTGLGLGSEEVVNGGFSSDSNWTKGTGWTIANGVAINQGNNGSQQILQTGVVSSNKTYEMTITVLSNEGTGNNTIYIGNKIVSLINLEVGTHTFIATPTSGSSINIFCSSGGEFSIDNVSVREITGVNTDVPRLDYTGGGCPSLLLEPQSTNYIQYSEDFSQSYWTKSNCVITSTDNISPEGINNATLVTDNNAGGTGSVTLNRYNFTLPSAGSYTYSVFVKKGTRKIIRLTAGSFDFTPEVRVFFDLDLGVVNSVEGTPDDYGIEHFRDGWYRLFLTFTIDGTDLTGFVRVQLHADDLNKTLNLDGTNSVYVWGADVQNQAYLNSHIPNYGNALGVTRSQDVAANTGDISSDINSQEGTFMIEATYLDSVLNRISLNDSATTYRNRISVYADNNRFHFIWRIDNVGDYALVYTSDLYENSKIAIRWKNGSITGYLNGVEGFTSTNIGEFPTGILDRITLGTADQGNRFKGRVKQLRIYDEYLSDSEMTKLTTL